MALMIRNTLGKISSRANRFKNKKNQNFLLFASRYDIIKEDLFLKSFRYICFLKQKCDFFFSLRYSLQCFSPLLLSALPVAVFSISIVILPLRLFTVNRETIVLFRAVPTLSGIISTTSKKLGHFPSIFRISSRIFFCFSELSGLSILSMPGSPY